MTKDVLKNIRKKRGLSKSDFGNLIGRSYVWVNNKENHHDPTSEDISEYINKLNLSDEEETALREIRKNNWEYDECKNPITNELIRIRNGLGVNQTNLSLILNRSQSYWKYLEVSGKPLTDDDMDNLDKEFYISSTTIKRYKTIVERLERGRPIPERYKYHNPEIQEPKDLYDRQIDTVEPELYMELIHEIEDENGGSVLNASEEDPKLIRLREMLGVIYYDE